MDVDKLSDEELRRRLLELGSEEVPPVTDTTRKLLRRRLQKLMVAAPTVKPSTSTRSVPVPAAPKNVVPDRRPTRTTNGADVSTGVRSPFSGSVIGQSAVDSVRRIRQGAALSSDEDDNNDIIYENRIKKPLPASVRTPIRAGGGIFGTKQESPSSDLEKRSSGSSGGISSWFNRAPIETPKTSTPQERRAGYPMQNSFGALTPIRDDVRARRPILGRPSLDSYSDEQMEDVGGPRKSLISRFLPDPIHLTPQSRDGRAHHATPHPRPIRIIQDRKDMPTANPRWVSALLIALAALFFAGVGFTYWRMKYGAHDIDSTIMHFQLQSRSPADVLHQCSDIVQGLEQRREGLPCYNEEEILAALNMGAALSKGLARAKGAYECGDKVKPNMDVVDARTYAIEAVPGSTVLDFGRAVDLIVDNPHWGIRALDSRGTPAKSTADVKTFESDYAIKSWTCQMKEALASALFRFFLGLLALSALIGAGLFLRSYWQHRQKRQAQVYDMVDRIIDNVTRSYEASVKDSKLPDYVVVAHLRESLAPHGRDRKELLAVWNEAVKYIASHESRIATDFELVGGEEFEVWRWLPTQVPQAGQQEKNQNAPKMDTRSSVDGNEVISVAGVKARNWGGGANPRMNIPTNLTAATPCLKVRGMFDGRHENQNDLSWTRDVEDAILEKCHGIAQIQDMRVEPQSDEGIVYIKLATNEDARNAYLALHGQYFDGNLLNVKFLKLDRYHARFPDAVKNTLPLHPSKFALAK